MSYKRLYLSSTDKKIAGVCGGLAEYLDMDPTVIRIIFLVALLCGTFGFWAYLIIWIAAPKADEFTSNNQHTDDYINREP